MARSQTTPLPAVPLRTPPFTGVLAKVLWSRTWVIFFEQLTGALAGIGGNTSGSSASEYVVPIVAGVATPDASKGTNILNLTADTRVAAAINFSADADLAWDLVTREDATGGWSTIFDSSYYMTTAIATAQSPAKTQCHVTLKTTPGGNTYLAGAPSIDQPIPPA